MLAPASRAAILPVALTARPRSVLAWHGEASTLQLVFQELLQQAMGASSVVPASCHRVLLGPIQEGWGDLGSPVSS